MLRELLTGLAVVFKASSVIISSIFRSSKYERRQLHAKNVSDDTSTTAGVDIPATKSEPSGSDSPLG
jgi:hypothetical protein